MSRPFMNPSDSWPLDHPFDDLRFANGVALFNAGRYFDAHEEWELFWRECPAPDRRFVHALIHAAVALYQWERGNATGAVTQYERGRAKALEFPPAYRGIDSRSLWDELAGVLSCLPGSRRPPYVTLTVRSHDRTDDDRRPGGT